MKASCASALVLGLCVLQISAWPLDGLFGSWSATTAEPSTNDVSEHEVTAKTHSEKNEEAPPTQPVNLHAHNAAQSADVAEQAAKVSKRVAAHTEQVARDTAAALRYTQEALKRANAKSEDIAEVGREAEKLEDEVGGSGSASNHGEAAKTGGKEETEGTSNTAAESKSDSRNRKSSNLDTNADESSSSISRNDAESKASATKTSDTKDSKSSSSNSVSDAKTSKSGGSNESGGSSSSRGSADSDGGSGASHARGAIGNKEANGGNGASGGSGGDAKQLDVNSEIVPYPSGVEPFGQEEPAKELTKASVKHSDKMVDQIENAQGTEAKRSVFRALTKLRGATIASYDGIAKGHLKNVDRYNAQHKWRDLHPMRHLAQEEADTHIWAFPRKGFQKGKSPKTAAAPAPAAADSSDASAAAEE